MIIKDKTFNREKIDIDFNEFENCTFNLCTMIYHGQGPVGLSNCTFNDVEWNFSGAASRTLNFLNALYHGAGSGGKQLIQKTFENIKIAKPK